MTQDNDVHIEHGGITRKAAKNSVPLVAASYSHPALGDRTIVRLIPEALVEAEDLALGVTGLQPGNRVNVGHIRRRAVGFPAWPILNDPDNAHHALNLVADLERAARRARTKPGHAETDILALVDQLDGSAPHFLPTFLEEAARIFLGLANTRLAMQMFTRAREVERKYALPIDDDRHYDAIMEFAYAGAISSKELTAEAQHLADRLEPAKAYQVFRTLCVERIRAGFTPHVGMKRDLTKLAKAAGLKPAEEDVRLISELLCIGTIQRSSGGFWKNYKTTIRKAAAQDENLRTLLVTLRPREVDDDIWLEILETSGALDVVKNGTHPEFVPFIVGFLARRTWPTPTNPKLPQLLADIVPQAGCTSVPVHPEWLDVIPAAALEQLLAHDVTITLTHKSIRAHVDLAAWARTDDRVPLPRLAASEAMRQHVINGILQLLDDEAALPIVATDPHLKPLVIELLTEQVELLESAPPTVDRLTDVTQFARHFEFVDDPEVQALLNRVRAYHGDIAEVLTETLRRGLLDELGWPEFERSYMSMNTGDERPNIRVQDCWPGVIVSHGRNATYVRGSTRRSVPNWTGRDIYGAVEADGQFAIAYYDNTLPGPAVSWSGSREPIARDWYLVQSDGLEATVPVPGGRLVGPDTILRPDHPAWVNGSSQFFVEEDRIWMVHRSRTVVEVNPETGAQGRESMPPWFEEQRRNHPNLVFIPKRSQLRPVCEETADSPFSTAEGYHRHAVFTRPDDNQYCLIVDADGTEYTVTGTYASSACGVIRLPDGQPRILVQLRERTLLLHPADYVHTTHHGIHFDTALWWHHARPRDPELSARLRTITADELRPLLERVAARNVEDADEEIRQAVSDLLGISDTAVRNAVAKHALTLTSSWPNWESSDPAKTVFNIPALMAHRYVLSAVTDFSWARFDPLNIWRGAAKLGLHDRDVPHDEDDADFDRDFRHSWIKMLGHLDALLALAAVPGRTAEEIQGLKELWILMREAGIVEAPHLVVEKLAITKPALPDSLVFPPLTLHAGKCHYDEFLLARTDNGEPLVIDGHTFDLVERREIPPTRTDYEPIFDALIERARTEGPRPWSPEPGETFAAATGMPLADAHLIMAGFPGFNSIEWNFLPKELRTAMGLKVAEAAEARKRLKELREHFLAVLAAGVPDDASALLEQGLDAEAMAAAWPEHRTVEDQLPAKIAERRPADLPEEILRDVIAGEHKEENWSTEVASVLWLAHELDAADPLRPALANYAEELERASVATDHLELGGYGADYEIQQHLGIPSFDENGFAKETKAGRYWVNLTPSPGYLFGDLSDITDREDPEWALAYEWGVTYHGDVRTLAALNLRFKGALTDYAEWLREQGEGEPHDPLVMVPKLVAEVSTELKVSEDAARYYLQLLAWADPTDANVRHWNGWKKADITRAGNELVEAGVVVTAKRPRAGRNFFLHGAWVEAFSPYVPIELWKTDPFEVFFTGARRNKAEPMLGVAVAPEPPPQWFATCWQRSQGDDAPRFAELETTRRRRP